jgi:hypothetical protein
MKKRTWNVFVLLGAVLTLALLYRTQAEKRSKFI